MQADDQLAFVGDLMAKAEALERGVIRIEEWFDPAIRSAVFTELMSVDRDRGAVVLASQEWAALTRQQGDPLACALPSAAGGSPTLSRHPVHASTRDSSRSTSPSTASDADPSRRSVR